MGYAYAFATGKVKNCPDAIKDVAKSFTKKNKKKGIKSLRDFAKTKHEGLPMYKENIILKFIDFKMNENNDVISFLYSFKNADLNGYINDFLTTNRNHKSEYIEDILSEISKKVDKEKYAWIKSELKKI